VGCLDVDTIVAFVEARIGPDGMAATEAHVRTCPSCRERLALAVAAAPLSAADDAPVEPPPQAPPPTSPFTPLARGTAIGRYTVLELLGRGGMGEVYAAYDPELDRKVALKILHAGGGGSDSRGRSRLLREAKAIAKLRHPNVVVVHDAGTIGERVFLAMEHVDGVTLGAWLAERPRTRAEILAVFSAAGRGLGAAHAAGLVHRDFKPQNVMVGRDGDVRVMDFGLARSIDEAPEPAPRSPLPLPAAADESAPTLTRTGELLGTPLYMAPEQFRALRTDARTDQFSFCVTLHQALYGAFPFSGAGLGELMAAVTAGRVQPPPPKSAVPPWLRRIVLRGLSVDPAARWPSMQALTAALSRDPARRRNRWLAGGAAAAVMIAGAVALRASAPRSSVCRGGPKRLAEVWETESAPGSHPHRDAIGAAFLKTGVAHAAETWARAARLIDDYAGKWLGMYGDACEATQVRGEQSAEVLDLRMTCLADRLGRVKALGDVFAAATPTVVDNAVSAASALPPLDRCADVQLLRAVVPPPDDPAARARVEELKGDLARVKALGDSGQCSAAAAAGRRLVDDARKVGYLALEGESLVELARGGGECMGTEEMVRTCRRAFLISVASRDEEVAAEAATFLGHIEADRTSELADARSWIEIGGALIQGMRRPHPVFEAWRLSALARVYGKEGDLRAALDAFQRALTLIEKTEGTEHMDDAKVLNGIGVLLADFKRYQEALDYYRRAIDLMTKIFGPDHPMLALALANQAEALNGLHRYDDARAAAERALAIWHTAGSSSFYEAVGRTILGEALAGAGRGEDAAPELERARTLFGDTPSSYADEATFALARTLWGAPAREARALALAREARDGYQRLGNAPTEVASVDAWLRAHAPDHDHDHDRSAKRP